MKEKDMLKIAEQPSEVYPENKTRWWEEKDKKLQTAADKQNMKAFLREIYSLPCYWGVYYIQCANLHTASVRKETFKINHGYHILERQNQQWWSAKESWAVISKIYFNTDISTIVWPRKKNGSWMPAPSDTVFPASEWKAESREAQAAV